MNGADSWFWIEDPLPYVERKPLMLYIGVDPGVSGGIAVIDERGTVVATHKMPDTGQDLIDLFDGYSNLIVVSRPPARACIEKVNPGVFGKGKVGKMGV